MFGLSLPVFTQLHVAISLIAIGFGLIFFAALAAGRWLGFANNVFLIFTLLTSVTGFGFPPKPIGPPFIFGVISLALLALSLIALEWGKLAGRWRTVYLLPMLIAQWLNMVVLVVQSFQKIPALHGLAPGGTEPPFLAAQALVLAFILAAGWLTVVRPRAPMARG